MNDLRRLVTTLATVALAGGLAPPALAAESATVDANVTMAAPCLLTNTPSIDFGVLTFSPDAGAHATSTQPISYASCSDADELVYVHGTDASGSDGASWALGAFSTGCPDDGLNRFWLSLETGTGPVAAVATFDTSLGTVSPGSQGEYGLIELNAPCVGSDGAGQSMSFSVVFTASF